MKKHYLLTIVAGLICNLVANAETLLPDSIISYGENGQKITKHYYLYDANRKKIQSEVFDWDVAKSDWALESKTTFAYDAAGNNTGEILYSWNGSGFQESQICTFVYDDQNRLMHVDLNDIDYKRHFVETYAYKGKEIYISQEDTTWMPGRDIIFSRSRTKYQRTLDNAGNVVEEVIQSYFEDDNEWFTSRVAESEYDSEGRCAKVVASNYNPYGELSSTEETTRLYDGKSYTQIYRSDVRGESDSRVTETKYEVSGENPEIHSISLKDTTTGTWKFQHKISYYYPSKSSTSNETITPESKVKVFAMNGILHIQSAQSMNVQVFAINGSCRYNARVNGTATVSGLPAGIYVVRANDRVIKVNVR